MRPPHSCDTSVVLPPLTADGSVILAKNSDRPVNESQPLVNHPRQSWPVGSVVKTQYLTIPQVETTWESIGSAPWWLWGYEMGVNEWGVTIGNEAVHTREPSHDRALIGMDLVRLGLERATSADEAVAVIGALLEQYGQGGPCEFDSDRTYQNSFIVADCRGAWILETAGHHWVACRVRERGAISNLLTIGADWDAASPGMRDHAESQGWWSEDGTFASAYADPAVDLATSTCRIDRARDVLGYHRSGVTVDEMMALLRDHAGGDLPTGAQPLPTICMHANPVFPSETAASMVVQIRPDLPRLVRTTIWTAFGSPCLSVFRPVYPYLIGLPDSVSLGSGTYDSASPWWQWEHVQRMVARQPDLAPIVRQGCVGFEPAIREQTARAELHARERLDHGDETGAIAILRTLVDETTASVIALAAELTETLRDTGTSNASPDLTAYWDKINAAARMPGRAIDNFGREIHA